MRNTFQSAAQCVVTVPYPRDNDLNMFGDYIELVATYTRVDEEERPRGEFVLRGPLKSHTLTDAELLEILKNIVFFFPLT